jgi:hypothetical protein
MWGSASYVRLLGLCVCCLVSSGSSQCRRSWLLLDNATELSLKNFTKSMAMSRLWGGGTFRWVTAIRNEGVSYTRRSQTTKYPPPKKKKINNSRWAKTELLYSNARHRSNHVGMTSQVSTLVYPLRISVFRPMPRRLTTWRRPVSSSSPSWRASSIKNNKTLSQEILCFSFTGNFF